MVEVSEDRADVRVATGISGDGPDPVDENATHTSTPTEWSNLPTTNDSAETAQSSALVRLVSGWLGRTVPHVDGHELGVATT